MKTMIKSALLLICGLSLWASCADDRDSNPTIQRPTSFTMNTPAYATFHLVSARIRFSGKGKLSIAGFAHG